MNAADMQTAGRPGRIKPVPEHALFNQLGIDTLDVLEAAGTKWNFLPFRPGLVGGHCISVDPYYLTHKAQEVGHHPQLILAGRRTNDGMGGFVADQVIKLMVRKRSIVYDVKYVLPRDAVDGRL